ncbi:MAG: hypothetical protein HQM11_17095 [SAR324 cluster bacterium]|nr:hypothetical protein [SAR324 cluster bacterium]
MKRIKHWLWRIWILIAWTTVALAQEPSELLPETTASGETKTWWQVGLLEMTYQGYTEHPFYVMTGNEKFRDGGGSFNASWANVGGLSKDRHTEAEESRWGKLAHSLPPFSIEYLISLESSIISALSWTGGYTNTWLTDNTSKNVQNDPIQSTPMIHLRTHYYYIAFSFYAEDSLLPPPLRLFAGVGAMHVESTLHTAFREDGTKIPVDDLEERYDHFVADSLIGFQRAGLTLKGQQGWGLSAEFWLLDNNPVLWNPFYHSRLITTTPEAEYVGLGGHMWKITGIIDFE